MICIGYSNDDKKNIIEEYIRDNKIKKVFFLSSVKFFFKMDSNVDIEWVKWEDIIQYVFFYRLLQEIDKDVLIVINECLRTQNRNDLTYNCIKHYLHKTTHRVIFQYLPIIENIIDFFILFDFDTRSQWRKHSDFALLSKQNDIRINPIPIKLNKIEILTTESIQKEYAIEKEKLFENIRLSSPDIIPRRLYQIGGKLKFEAIKEGFYVGRNNRFKIKKFDTFKSNELLGNDYTIFEIAHNFIDFIDFIFLARQSQFNMMVSDLKIDSWYFNRYQDWIRRVENVYSNICK